MEWQAATIDDVSRIVECDLKGCGDEQSATFARYRVDLYLAPLSRYGKDESVVIVARRRNEVIYWEDVEEGFNCSPVGSDGRILQHWCNQDDLCLALRVWTDEDLSHPRFVPDRLVFVTHDVEHQKSKIREWMQHVLATDGIERFDDLHIDEIDASWTDRAQWVPGIKESLQAAGPIRSTIAPDKVLALVCSLQDGPCEAPLNLEKLAAQFDWSPPSLYLFHPGREPWKHSESTSRFTRLPLDGFPELGLSELFLQEWTVDDALQRSFFGV